MAKRPSFQFYPGDWLRDTALRTCSVGARGLWMDMLCIMHQGEPYGHLNVKGNPLETQALSRMVGATPRQTASWLAELEGAKVFSRTDAGEVFSRRMVADEATRAARAAGGHLGGNPALTGKDNLSSNLQAGGRLNSRPTPSSSSSSSASPSVNGNGAREFSFLKDTRARAMAERLAVWVDCGNLDSFKLVAKVAMLYGSRDLSDDDLEQAIESFRVTGGKIDNPAGWLRTVLRGRRAGFEDVLAATTLPIGAVLAGGAR